MTDDHTHDTTEPELTTELPPEPGPDTNESQSQSETFPREYVEQLRRENAEQRAKAKRADDLARQLFAARVTATGRLADPADLPFDDALLDDADGLTTAIDALLADKPHYAARRPFGEIGQGATETGSGDVDLAGILRSRA